MDVKVDFLGIGAQKSATTWLHANLAFHPETWLPPRKELHYFSRPKKYPTPNFMADDRFEDRLNGTTAAHENFRRILKTDTLRASRREEFRELRWYVRYYTETICDDWYCSLFEDGADRVKGEITPAYSVLDKEDVQHIKELFPDLKVLFVMRNPMDRAWSHFRFVWKNESAEKAQDPKFFESFVQSRGQLLRSDYLRTLSIWESVFSADQILTMFFEEIRDQPATVLERVSEFLGISPPAPQQLEQALETVHVSKPAEQPEAVNRYLASFYHDDLIRLTELYGEHAEKWLREAEQVLASSG